jgi:hypothetical protein
VEELQTNFMTSKKVKKARERAHEALQEELATGAGVVADGI